LNEYLHVKKVKLDHLEKVAPEIPNGCWFASQDLSSGYFHLKVFEGHHTLLGIRWQFRSGEEVMFVWKCTFLGISHLVFWFTKMLLPHKTYLQRHGIQVFCYLDDFLILGLSREDCKRKRDFARRAWLLAGWVENMSKSTEPSQVCTYLGLTIDSIQMRVFVPPEKKDRILQKITDRDVGCLVSFGQGVGQHVRLGRVALVGGRAAASPSVSPRLPGTSDSGELGREGVLGCGLARARISGSHL
jgi:hypothetical protein